jgi:Predicted outer membrane lipoprotein
MTTLVVAVFPSFAKAQIAVERILHMGIDSAAISLLYADPAFGENLEQELVVGQEGFKPPVRYRLAEEVSPALGLLLGIGQMSLPGVGKIVAGGPLATALSSILADESSDPFRDLLRNAGLSPDETLLLKESLRRGLGLVMIHTTRNMSDHAQAALDQVGALDMQRQAEEWRAEGWLPVHLSEEEFGLDRVESGKLATLGGTLVGAATGAALGSFGGPLGTAIGSVAGAISGGAIGAASEPTDDSLLEVQEETQSDEHDRAEL